MFDSSKWIIKTQSDSDVALLSKELKIDSLCARLLINRGYVDVEQAKSFIEKSDVCFHNPFLLKDIKKAVGIIKEAIENQEKITIYGDYDVDGVSSVSILYMYLKDCGADVDYYIPTRENEGYGLNKAAFDTIKKRGTDLIITVDTGITAIDEIDYANSIGLRVIVTDHHECRPEIPNAEAVVNPKRPDCEYPFKELSGVGVVFKILCALELEMINGGEYNHYTIKDMCQRYIDIVTIGTIADVMPLVGENRVIVHLGLELLKNTRNVGIKSLFRAAGIIGGSSPKNITSSTISFTVAPKINAVGRMGSAERAVKLFLTDSVIHADSIAEELCAINRERQDMENIIYRDAIKKLENEFDPEKDKVVVLASDKWHHGVIGIVASRITEKLGVPTVLISFDGAEPDENGVKTGKGSVRSVGGINIVEALTHCSDLLCKFGGHALAAGLSIEETNVNKFREKLNEYISGLTVDADLRPKTEAEALIDISDATEQTAEYISLLEPYGAGNPIPLFAMKDVVITEMTALSNGKHTKMTLSRNGFDVGAVIFGTNLGDEGFSVGDEVDVICSIDINEFRGERNVQLILRDIDRSSSEKAKVEAEAKKIKEYVDNPAKICPDDIPTRSDFVEIYNEIRKINGGKFNFAMFAAKFSEMSGVKVAVAIEALKQAGIIQIKSDIKRPGASRIVMNKIEGKSDLTKTPIMTEALKEKNE